MADAIHRQVAEEICDFLEYGCPEIDTRYRTLFPYNRMRLAMHLVWIGQELCENRYVDEGCKHIVKMGDGPSFYAEPTKLYANRHNP